MEAMQERFGGGAGQQVLRKEQITYQDFHGMEVEIIDTDRRRVLFRVFKTPRYIIGISYGSVGQLNRTEAARFLDSVQILEAKPGNLN